MRPSNERLLLLAAGLIGVALVWLTIVVQAYAHHNGPYLPSVPNTPVMQSIITNGETLWCVNDRAAAYPNFVSQLTDVYNEYYSRVGFSHRQVAWGTPASTGCQVQHNMILNHPCGGCAAWVFYQGWPAVVEYKTELMYSDWRTAMGHELGHALLGLHEEYVDTGTIGCDAGFSAMITRLGFATVMSCGTGVRYPTEQDVIWGCVMLDAFKQRFVGCGYVPAPQPVWTTRPEWNGEWRWYLPWNGRSGVPRDDGCWRWYNSRNQLVLADCAPWGGRYVKAGSSEDAGIWLHRFLPDGTPNVAYTLDEWWELP